MEVYFSEPTWAPVLGSKFVSNIISPSTPIQWTFYVTPSDSGNVTLQWNPQDVPTNIGLTLADQASGNSVLMRSVSNYSFATRTVRQFTITSTVTNVELSDGIPTSYSLSQNYPNPFNPSTVISFALPQRSNVRLEIFNILGQKIAQLIDGQREAGLSSTMWNANVSSGLYFYRLEAVSVVDPSKRFVDTKKMLLLK